MVRWLTVLALLGPTVSGWASGGAAELHHQARLRNFWGLLGKEPGSVEEVREGALRAAALGDGALCRELFENGALQFPDHAGLLHFELGGAMSRLGRPQAAAVAFRRAVESRAGLRVSFAYLALAALHERQGELAEAWSVYQELVRDEDALSIHLVEAAAFALRHGKEEAQTLFESSLAKGTEEGANMEARVLRRWAGLQQGEEALALYDRLHAGTETEAADFQRAAILALELRHEKRWEEYFRAGLERHPEARGWLRYEWAVQLERLGQWERALEFYGAAKKEPSGLKAGYAFVSMAKLLEKTGKVVEAAAIMGELLRLREVLPQHVAEAGALEARQGRKERALELYLEAFQRAREEDDQIAVGNLMSEGAGVLPGLKELAQWFRLRTERLPPEERQRLRRALATTFGNHSWKLLSEGTFAEAGVSAEMALVIYEPDILKWVEGNRAHAYLFQGRVREARAIHERYRTAILELEGFDWEKAVREDFKIFREKGLVPAPVELEMRRIEALLGLDAGPGGPETNPGERTP